MVRKLMITASCALFTLLAPNGKAQNTGTANTQKINARSLFSPISSPDSTEYEEEIQVPGKGVENLDSLLSIWYTQKALNEDPIGIVLLEGEDLPPALLSDSIYINRLNNITSVISLPYNDVIRNHIIFYTQKMPQKLEMLLGLSEYYFPIIEDILDQYGLPLELKVMPIIESGFNNTAKSYKGAVGMWQFIIPAAKDYNLTVNSFVDERCDFIASTHAAARYLKTMYKIFNDWTLAIASYNCGWGNVRKAIMRAGGKTSYWDIYPYLPKETRNYVPAFIAATYATTYYREHKYTPKKLSFPMVDTFMINQNLHFEQISDLVGIPIDELRDLNPQYRRNVIPGRDRPYELRIPFEYSNAFIQKERALYGYKDSVYFNSTTVVIPATLTGTKYASSSAEGKQKKLYRVKKGETLGGIADKYGVKISDLQYWNNLGKKSSIHANQKLIVYRPADDNEAAATPAKATTTATTAAATTKDKVVATDKDKATQTATVAVAATTKAKPKTVYHTVKKNETVWAIAQKYDDVSYYDVLKLNGLSEKSKIKVGQKLKIK